MASQDHIANTRAGYEPGEVLRRRKGLVMHAGLSLGDDRVLHNTPNRGEHVSSIEEFHKGRRMRVSPATAETRRKVESIDGDNLGRKYSLLTNNCEHTANRILTGESKSPQLRSAAFQLAAGVLLLAVFRKPLLAVGLRLGARLLKP